MKKAELIEALTRLAMGRLDAVPVVADLLMPDEPVPAPVVKPAPAKGK